MHVVRCEPVLKIHVEFNQIRQIFTLSGLDPALIHTFTRPVPFFSSALPDALYGVIYLQRESKNICKRLDV